MSPSRAGLALTWASAVAKANAKTMEAATTLVTILLWRIIVLSCSVLSCVRACLWSKLADSASSAGGVVV